MTDKVIIALYFKRSENAIVQTDVKYGKLCHSISINILNDTRDSEECVNDTYLTLWNKIPPKEPNPFKAYICRIIKNLSLKKYEFNQFATFSRVGRSGDHISFGLPECCRAQLSKRRGDPFRGKHHRKYWNRTVRHGGDLLQ